MIARLLLVCLPCLLLCGCAEFFHTYYVNYGETKRSHERDDAICKAYAAQVQPFVFHDTWNASGGWTGGWATAMSGQNNLTSIMAAWPNMGG